MSEKQNKNPFHDSLFQRGKPVKQKGKPVQKSDPDLDDELEEEIEDIEKIEGSECVLEPDKCSVCELKDQVIELKNTLEASREKLLRAHAEMENLRSRAERNVQDAHRFALEKFVNELLPVIDSLERALESVGDDKTMQVFIEGVELTMQMFLKVLEQFGVKQINPVGEPFDPQHHEAISIQDNPEVEPNTVIIALQKGYVLNGRLVRPARVIVSK